MARLKVLVRDTGAQFAGFANQWQTHWINATDDLTMARAFVARWREHGGAVSGRFFPDETQAVITADWAVAKYEVIVDGVYDDDDYPWFQSLGLTAAEVQPS